MTLQRIATKSTLASLATKYKEQGYNGWSNWDTWNANLHITNDETSYRIARRINRQELPVFFEDNFVHINELRDYDGINLKNVAWDEIFEGLHG